MEQSVLKIKNVSKWFGKRKIIDDISLEVFPGEIFGFLGPNGAGKTTMIKMIMGFLNIDRGEVFINGISLKKNYEEAMKHIGGIVENPEMYKDLSGMVNLKMYARLHEGVSEERIREVVKLVGMEKRVNDKLKKYSLGMKQRIGVAQSIVHKPKILVLDEPTNGLDPSGIRELRDIFKKLAHEGNVAVFVSSHLLSEMQLMCDRVGIIHNGKLLGVKGIKELMQDASSGTFYRFMTDRPDDAYKVIKDKYGDAVTRKTGEFIEIEITQEKVPELNKIFAMNDIPIFAVNKTETSLEDAFISMTGGGSSIE